MYNRHNNVLYNIRVPEEVYKHPISEPLPSRPFYINISVYVMEYIGLCRLDRSNI